MPVSTAPAGYQCGVTIDDDRRPVRIRGDLDAVAAGELARRLRSITDRAEVVVDLRDVGFTDSAGLNALVAAHFDLAREGRVLRLVNVPSRLWRLLEMTGLDEVLHAGEEPATGAEPGGVS
jgi:anti-sigma B factor antagonist